jgi:hypothetical protein
MTTNIRRFIPGLTATAGAVLASAFLSSAYAHADNDITFVVTPTDGASEITSIGGIAPFDQTISYTGEFAISVGGAPPIDGALGDATFYSDIFGLHNVEFVGTDELGVPGYIIDDLSFGNGFDNIYSDVIGNGPGGTNDITDILVTPFGNFDIPTTFDALDFPGPLGAAALDTDFSSFAAALDADWTTLVGDFSALF